MLAFIMFSYVWPRLSNGFVMQDQASKILAPCDDHSWVNLLMFHNHAPLNETCLWPTHVSASFFQLHILSYPIIVLLLLSLKQQQSARAIEKGLEQKFLAGSGLGIVLALAALGLIYPALQASGQELIVPFLIDYLDYDNYQRVIEWTVMPTHNHLTSYMTGILLAYVVALRLRARRQREMQPRLWHSGELYTPHDGSLESVESSSTSCQELNMKPAFMFNKRPEDKLNRLAATGGASTSTTSTSVAGTSDAGSSASSSSSSLLLKRINQVLSELALIMLLLASITASYLWNGLSEPMTSQQTFWYMICTKLAFNLAFAGLFYRHFATRTNSANPWIITRFLVPIGRMSLMLFYVSWPVIWFDLLASLYQWHPSHYFIFEKYNEIIFMSLIISMFAYGAFEGTVKILDYRRRAEAARLRRQSQKSPHGEQKLQATTGFDNLFQPTDWDEQPGSGGDNQVGAAKSVSNNQMFSKGSAAAGGQQTNRAGAMVASHPGGGLSVPPSAHKTKGSPTLPAGSYGKRLSIADQYKLNAELRANYSFASIGLYESAGATDDLPASNRSEPDPQASPGLADKAQQRHF